MNHPGNTHAQKPGNTGSPQGDRATGELRLVAWETTRNCNLSCVHCRASANMGPFSGELDTAAAYRLLDEIVQVGNPIIILTGGEPLLRPDIFEIAAYGTGKGLRMTMAPNGTLITPENARKMKETGIQRISISIDGSSKEAHDRFRGVPGAFEGALRGIELAKSVDLEFQINTTITQTNLAQLPDILKLAENLGAVAHHIFLLIPTGRGKYIADQEISAQEYESTLNWFYDHRDRTSMQLKATCAPHYYRILRQRAKEEAKAITFQTHGMDAVTRGCLGGTGFCFVSHRGIVQPCGFLDLNCGDVTQTPFYDIWRHSEHFITLRNYKNLKGKCGRCEYKNVCGGCRARAFEATGDFLQEEPLCSYQPASSLS
ncbi:MAG: heme b synthase [Desulfobacteraceae bacterium]|nr:heme b synthase [Desulfobacteraceae bacterium]MBU4002268.1 heme b synthase [Pseudomonadota bacterium]